jgi:hypothetical protein
MYMFPSNLHADSMCSDNLDAASKQKLRRKVGTSLTPD